MRRLHSVSPNQPETQYLLATLYAQLGRLSDALNLARELQRAEPKSVRPWVLTGALLVAEQNPREAVGAFEKALASMPEASKRTGTRPGIQAPGPERSGRKSYRRALDLNGDDVATLNDLAWLLSEIKKKPEEALPLAQKAERLAPQLPWVSDTLGWIHYRRQSYTDAERVLSQAAERAPSNAVIRFHLGMTYTKLGRIQDAVSALGGPPSSIPSWRNRERIEKLIKELES